MKTTLSALPTIWLALAVTAAAAADSAFYLDFSAFYPDAPSLKAWLEDDAHKPAGHWP
jgi:hypothetical protein